MNRETIEQAAKDYVERHYPACHPFKEHDVNVFMQGARWRINSAWHDMLIQVGKDDWADVLELTKFVKWADVDDLLPDGKEIRP